ncbi:MAG: CPBP family intramembrane metalloprotease [Anaerolineae bacterium]|uniref:CPBP family intramembrane glutamic endopeptidase n=1 Tax=Promineifilum sp. TaxID=2664178 RepID=UPI002411A28F|nr:CPBP family intramembrane metalloprotease [Promineifilum sp.]MCW5847773.1 CPBP family intramembrane metalloprotease [Anaerolineae bacterium]
MNDQLQLGNQPAAPIKRLFARHPIPSAVALFALDLPLGALAGIAAKALLPQADPSFIAMCVLAVVIAGLLTLLRWWREAGFNDRGQWRELRLLWVPAVVAIVLPLLGGFTEAPTGLIVYLTIGYLITGFMEEAWVRGLMLRVLQPVGPVRAVLISALLFALLHMTNFLFRNPAIVLAQMVGAFCFGLAFGALRLRTNTIWFLVALHMLHDLLLHLSGFPTIPLDVVQDVILLIYGIYLLRGLRNSLPSGEEVAEERPSAPQMAG